MARPLRRHRRRLCGAGRARLRRVSINLERILKYEGLPERALETLLFLVSVLLVSIVGLIPGQSHGALGVELFAVSALIAAAVTKLPVTRSDVGEEPRSWLLTRWGVRIAATVPLVVGGASVLIESGGGLYWVAAGIVLAIVGAVANAWVLLVEILR